MFFNIVGQVIVGWLLADILSGVFHWWQDRWPSASTRWIGNYLIAPSRLHHQKPVAFTEGSFMYRNGATFLGTMITALPLLMIFGIAPLLISMTIGGLISTQVHYLAHCPSRANKLGRLLQVSGIIQSPKHHAQHHRSPHEMRYCVLTNAINPVLDDLKLWNKLEVLLTSVGFAMSHGKH